MVVPGTLGVVMPGWLLAMITAIAPASRAKFALMANEHVPRRMTAIVPAKVSAGYAAQPSLVPSMPALAAVPGISLMGVVPGMLLARSTPLEPGVSATAASAGGTAAGPVTLRKKSNPWRPCCAAAVEATQGSLWPRVPAPGPELPADVAT